MKRCKKCLFSGNPDNSHFCAKCGTALEPGQWELYDSAKYVAINRERYAQIMVLIGSTKGAPTTAEFNNVRSLLATSQARVRSLEGEVDNLKKERDNYRQRADSVSVRNSMLSKELTRLRNKPSLWKRIEKYFDTHEWPAIIMVLTLSFVIFGALVYWIAVFGDSSPTEPYQVFKENGKSGIRLTSDDRVLVPADYDSIMSRKRVDNQWPLVKDGLVGIAYVTDSVVRIVDPMATDVAMLRNNGAILTLADNKKRLVHKGEFTNTRLYDDLLPLYSTGNVIARIDNNKWCVISSDGRHLSADYRRMSKGNDSTVVAWDGTVHLLDGNGQAVGPDIAWLRDNSFYMDVQWCCLTDADYSARRWSLIDDRGNTILTLSPGSATTYFSSGTAFYRNGKDSNMWTAVNTRGEQQFNIKAREVFSYFSDLARVDLHNGQSGFIGLKGEWVIPAAYTRLSNYYFYPDSFITATRCTDNIRGTLYRSGRFVANK